jgi:hypothetical protein
VELGSRNRLKVLNILDPVQVLTYFGVDVMLLAEIVNPKIS